ncbi:CBS domain containing-hemolysin-like protein [Anaerosolibacter carboniphilus]|uniref:CBS domain containing-hemolysin-like protein n=1 Tax=Anaerosolibacter carboniphilus TaxID=1417629 RepID=A0A841L699_9FIRM|nr:hemolysin family protein [Anaerosolibacter carboniphilus]MBB6217919.1 CBS domain containing-hemolysin-like protein [Anaerosolibacter carboniphilus]
MFNYNDSMKLAILFILLTLSALFSSAETAITSLNIIKIRQIEGKSADKMAILERLFRNSPKIISTILIGNNIVNIGATAIATELTYKFFQGKNVTALVTVVMTLAILIFGEITPKTFSANNPEKVALRLGRPVELLSYVLYPVLKILNVLTNFIIRLLGGKITEVKSLVSEEEIMTLVDVGEEAGIIESQERKMINSIFEIGDIEASEVMIPRIDMIYLDEEATLEEALNIAIDYGYSRIPVIKDTVDNVTGILYAKDLLASLRKHDEQSPIIDIRTFIRPAYYVPESKKVNELLKEMQKEKVHIAIVLDEYGGTLGLVTIEDILEEIVGDILDEYDAEIDLIEHLSENTLIVNAKASIEEINEILDVELPEDEYDSIGGFVFNALGRIPVKDDTIELDNITIKVLSVHNRRIKQLEIVKK